MTGLDELSVLRDPRFQKLLRQRSRLRWGLTGLLVGAYFVYSLAGIYASELLATRFMNSSISWWIVIGYLIMAVAIALSLAYVRIVRQLYSTRNSVASGHQR